MFSLRACVAVLCGGPLLIIPVYTFFPATSDRGLHWSGAANACADFLSQEGMGSAKPDAPRLHSDGGGVWQCAGKKQSNLMTTSAGGR